jgi:ABC-type nitrate/sulfonate/bicarbonate transport system substrate-binding protein
MRSMRTLRGIATIAMLALALAACPADEEPVADPDETDEVVDDDETDDEEVAEEVCATYTVAVLDDDSHRMAMYALENELIETEAIGTLEVNYLEIPALIGATGTDQFNVVQTSLPGVVLSREAAGLDVWILAVSLAHTGGGIKAFTLADSGIDEPEDLAGQTVGISSFGSTAAHQAQIVMGELGLNADFEGGDMDWVELDPPTLLRALNEGQIDAAVMWHTPGWMALNDEDIQVVVDVDNIYEDMTGAWPVGSAMTSTGEDLDANPECASEFQSVLEESVAYAEDNVDELAEDIGEETGMDPEFIRYWWGTDAMAFGGTLESPWDEWARAYFDEAGERGIIPPADFDELVWQP